MVTITPAAAFSDAVTAAELGVSLLALSQDSVSVYDSNFNQVFPNARPLRAEPIPRAKLMDHPVEDGQTNTDYKIILPLEVMMTMFIPAPYYRNTYQEIWNLWQSSELLTVQTKVGSYSNMVISEMPHEETTERYDAITMRLRFRQIQIIGDTSNFVPANVTDSNTQILGEQFPSVYTLLGATAGAATTALAIATEFR